MQRIGVVRAPGAARVWRAIDSDTTTVAHCASLFPTNTKMYLRKRWKKGFHCQRMAEIPQYRCFVSSTLVTMSVRGREKVDAAGGPSHRGRDE